MFKTEEARRKYHEGYRLKHRELYRKSSMKYNNSNKKLINKKRRKRYKDNPDYRAKALVRRGRWHGGIMVTLTDIKLQSGCKICGYKRSAGALAFHHIDKDKKKFALNFGEITINITNEQVLEEVKKCIVLCFNCHSEVHSGITKLPE